MTPIKIIMRRILKNQKLLVAFDDIIADMLSNKTVKSIATEPFIQGRKPNISSVFIRHSYLAVPKVLAITIHITLLWKFQKGASSNKLQLTIHFIFIL